VLPNVPNKDTFNHNQATNLILVWIPAGVTQNLSVGSDRQGGEAAAGSLPEHEPEKT
jgi:hypothetical protein